METEIDLDSEKENIRKLLKTGNSFKNIAENYNISTTKLWTFVRKNNLKENFKPFKERNRWIEDEISIVRDYLNDDKSIEEITKALNGKHSKDSVKTLITKQGKRYNLNYKHTRHYFTEKDIENIKKLSKEGYSPSKIAEELGLNKSSTPKLMKKLGIDTVDHNTDGFFRNHINLVLTKESIEELLIKKGKSTKEIAELAGVSVDSVYRRIKLFNIQRPVKEEKPISEGRKHKIDVLFNYLKRNPTKEELKKPLRDIFKKEDIEKKYIENDYNTSLAAESLKIDESTFRVLMRYNDIKIHYKTTASDFSDDFYKNCIESGMSYCDISEQIGLSSETIRKYIGKKLPKLKIGGEYVSSGENMVATVLKSFGINFKYNNLLYIEDNKTFIDFSFTIGSQEYWIEYNRKQHYEFVDYFFKTQERFEKQLKRDNMIREYAKDNNIILIELKYSDFTTTDKIREHLKTIFPSDLIQLEEILTTKDINTIEINEDILENFKKSKHDTRLIYIFDSKDKTIITIREACEKYNISETSAKRWSLEGKHGLISIYNPRINKANKRK